MDRLVFGQKPKKLVLTFFVLTLLLIGGLIALIFLPSFSSMIKIGLVIVVSILWFSVGFLFYNRLLALLMNLSDLKTRTEIEQLFLDALMFSAEDSIYLKDKNHRILMANAYMQKSLNLPLEKITGKTDDDLFTKEFAAQTASQEDEIFQSGNSLTNVIERRTDSQGSFFWTSTMKVPIKKEDDVIAILGITRKFDDIARVHTELEYAANHDHLTGLLNRGAGSKMLDQRLRSREKLVILFIDLDDFKSVNDRYGHEFGDKLLCEVSARLKNLLREGDIIVRYGGDEFIVLAMGATRTEGMIIAEKIIASFENPVRIHDVQQSCSLSIGGICCSGEEFYTDELAEKLIASADTAMYQAKKQGKNQFVICES